MKRLMKRSRIAPLVAAVLAFGLVFGAGSVGAQGASYSATLSGANEVPALDTAATGSFSASLSGDTLSYTLSSDATGVTQAHIHLGSATENGGVVAFLFGPVDPQDGFEASGTIAAADVIGDIEGDFQALLDAMDAGNAYANVHTEANPGGEVRGQISAAGATGLPATGSGGLADGDGGTATWIWALGAAAIAATVVGGGVQLARRRG